MGKIFYYNFLPTKTEEDAAGAYNVPYRVTRTLVEVKDPITPPTIDPNNPWVIKKTIIQSDLTTAKLTLSQKDTFDHIFRYWALDMANYVITGYRYLVILVDVTDGNDTQRYQSNNTYLERGPGDTYHIGWADLIREQSPKPGDEIWLCWDTRSRNFHFKLLRKGN